MVLSKAAKIVREDIFNSSGFQFNGTFVDNCQQESVPTNLKYLVSMLLNGSSINSYRTNVSYAETIITPPCGRMSQRMRHENNCLRTRAFFRI